MPKKYFRVLQKSPEHLHDTWLAHFLGETLHQPWLWHLHRNSVAKALFLGIFIAFLPLPGHSLLAIYLVIALRCNLPVTVAALWINNPITLGPIIFLEAHTGCLVLGCSVPALEEVKLGSLLGALGDLWLPLCIGSVVLGLLFGGAAYYALNLAWQYSTRRRWRKRQQQR